MLYESRRVANDSTRPSQIKSADKAYIACGMGQSDLAFTMYSDAKILLFNFINLTQVHYFTVSAQDIFTFRRLSVFTVSFTGISQVIMR